MIPDDAAATLKCIRPTQRQASRHRIEQHTGFFKGFGCFALLFLQSPVQRGEIPALLFQTMSQSLFPLLIERQHIEIILNRCSV